MPKSWECVVYFCKKLGLEISGIAQHSGFFHQILAEIWEDLICMRRRRRSAAAEWILQTENCLTSYAFFYAV